MSIFQPKHKMDKNVYIVLTISFVICLLLELPSCFGKDRKPVSLYIVIIFLLMIINNTYWYIKGKK